MNCLFLPGTSCCFTTYPFPRRYMHFPRDIRENLKVTHVPYLILSICVEGKQGTLRIQVHHSHSIFQPTWRVDASCIWATALAPECIGIHNNIIKSSKSNTKPHGYIQSQPNLYSIWTTPEAILLNKQHTNQYS